MRLACWPDWPDSVYLQQYHRALEGCGIQVVDADPRMFTDPTILLAHLQEVDVLHIHWPEDLWRYPGQIHWRLRWLPALRALLRLRRCLAVARRNGIVVVWTMHNVVPHELDSFVDLLGHRLLARTADLVICHSQSAVSEAEQRYGIRTAACVVMHHGNYDGSGAHALPLDVALPGLRLEPGRPTLLCVGAVRHYKGCDTAIDAARQLGERVQLVIAGRPWSVELERSLVSRANGADNVHFLLRTLTEQELTSLLCAADCVLLPYRQITGSGVLLAALSQGKGVVATDLPYFREVLAIEPDAGVLVGGVSGDAVSEGVREFLALPTARRSEAARRLARRFAWSEVVRPVAAAIHERLAARKLSSQPQLQPPVHV